MKKYKRSVKKQNAKKSKAKVHYWVAFFPEELSQNPFIIFTEVLFRLEFRGRSLLGPFLTEKEAREGFRSYCVYRSKEAVRASWMAGEIKVTSFSLSEHF